MNAATLSLSTKHRIAKVLAVIAFFASAAAIGARAEDADVRNERLLIWNAISMPSQPAHVRLDLLLPVEGVRSCNLRDSFGDARSHGRRHAAIDIMAPRNTPVLAAVDGRIRKLKTSVGGGLTIYEIDDSGHVYYYAHLQRYDRGLREGAPVRRGEVIGYVGTTGNAAPGAPHLHFAIAKLPPSGEWWKGTPIDPYPLLARRETAETAITRDALATDSQPAAAIAER